MVAAVRGVYPGAVGGEGAGFLAVEQPDRRFRCPEGELQGLSARLGTEVIWLGFQSVVDAFAYHHWDGGKHLRSLVYGMEQERVWERAEGTAEGWEAEVLFGDFERVMEDAEHPLLKIACRPLRPKKKRDPIPAPSIGDTMAMVITAVDTGVVVRPADGYVISLGTSTEDLDLARVGDTVRLLYTLPPRQPRAVREALTGTPRLVRDGRDDPEYEIEGSRARRFIDGRLARTAVGISRSGDTLFMVTVSSGSESENRTGMTLAQLAAFMRSIGAYQAMNFDGGGSASMAINGEMISRQGNRPTTRHVSNALLAVRPAKKGKGTAARN